MTLASKLSTLIGILVLSLALAACGDANDEDDVVVLEPDEEQAATVVTTTVTTSTVE